MPTIIIQNQIDAPPEQCFDLIRDIRIHRETTAQTNEKMVGNVTDRKVHLGQTVTFESKSFGRRQRLTVEVTEFEWPRLFVDEMIEGSFKSFRHVHEFFPTENGTLMRDTLTWISPFGVFGKIVDNLLLERHLRDLVSTRNKKLKELAEND